jgi:Zn-dependent peptidase ImmA (M78 family)
MGGTRQGPKADDTSGKEAVTKMTVIWERFAGTTDVFAIRLSFGPDPDNGTAIDLDESASWGRLQLWAGGLNLCAHFDQGEFLQGIHWYMLPFLEWIADIWNPLLHEERLPNRNIADIAVESLAITKNAPTLATEVDIAAWDQEWYDWSARHSLRTAREGGLFPNVVFRRLQDLIEISWDDELPAGAPAGFHFNLGRGSALLNPEDVAKPLYELGMSAVGYLQEHLPHSLRLQSLLAKLDNLPSPGQRETRLGWLVGLPGHAHNRTIRQESEQSNMSWEDVTRTLASFNREPAFEAAVDADDTPLVLVGSSAATLLFGSASPTISAKDVHTLGEVLINQYSPSGNHNEELERLSRSLPPEEGSHIWEQGYDLAESLHEDLNLAGDWIDVRAVVKRLGIQSFWRELDDTGIRGCSLIGPHHKSTIVLNKSWRYAKSPVGARFTFAHELCHILYDRSHAKKLAIASGPWAPRAIEKRANAFAAMFLMPSYLIERAIADSPDPITGLSGVKAIANKLRVSVVAAVEHLCNLTLMTETERDELLSQLGSGSTGIRL